MPDIDKLDLYAILEVAEEASEKDILKAYRKKALKCHPDKNPDNPKAAEEFHLLSQALEVLTDKSARQAYDNVVKARRAAAERHKALDEKRKKFKENLESKEKSLAEREAEMDKRSMERRAAKGLAAEIDRLKKEGNSLLLQEQEKLRETMRRQVDDAVGAASGVSCSVKVKWKASKKDESNGGYDEPLLAKIFNKYGLVMNVIVSSKKRGSALVEFDSPIAAQLARDNEIGLPDNPFKVQFVSESESSKPELSSTTLTTATKLTTAATERDFESLVMRKMRQAEERKRLLEEMQKEDNP